MKTVQLLKQLQADSIVLFMKIHNFHWNVRGSDFYHTHKATEEIYEKFADMFDDLAERIVQLGDKPVTTLTEALKIAQVKEEARSDFKSSDVFKGILADYEYLEKEFKKLSELADKDNDKVTAAYADEQSAQLQKSIWMLKAHLG
ncbi:Dps family protein [Helicobacter sp. 11S03491-1]|uniref:Dps family protein n=1 Tax=Helicobacter sp. 11S03491-1 TaxID=1476196 RepID=UPI000BA4F36B|nr:Dps family protein [Helicobacter sp. 11S03491-1]PAF43377.1 DNA starvation/stationary phase protection protein [Helicobacter sp. 11S03491-1]